MATKVTETLVVLLLLFFATASGINASSPAEPAFKSQLRSCFEANRNTECLATQSSWSSCGGSVYSSYQLALSISMNCMRSVCGSQNSLCCNTYCTMYGLSGYDHSVCFNKCFNGYTGSVVGAATLMKTIKSSLDTNVDYVPPATAQKKDDETKVYCDIPCNSEFAFYSTTGKQPSILNGGLKALLASNTKTNTLAAKKKLISSWSTKVGSSKPSSSSSSSRKSISSIKSIIGRSNSGYNKAISKSISKYLGFKPVKQINSDLVYKRLVKFVSSIPSLGYILRGIRDKKTRTYLTRGYKFIQAARKQVYPQKAFAIYDGKVLNVKATVQLGNPALVKQRSTIFPIPFNSLTPSSLSKKSFFNSSVKHNQICTGTAIAKVEYYRRSRITCKKIKSWISGASKINPKNIYQVNKFLFLVYNQCKKAKATCVVPFVEAIKTTD
ncbi:predicted protein [Naegleria gruberi]|uniref:Predicted protein n=1 Tax=Naegleria gruberi TaxID=5762 RepID=D2VDT6_NAEGR|nr:uncharacterized protein NAEGRDRAFT_67035 [Naegleria gruberi]EFC44956.1 predicted protein [Naegleria gruberi]|eukprot:XP_002677700.1 predicted protein [Naegleria gruberi strain NEG-M]